MILQQLYHDAGTILKEELVPPMYDRKPVRWLVRLEEDGRFLGYQSLGGDKDNKRGLPRMVPYLGRTSGVRPILLADSPAYVLGIALDEKEKRPAEKHTAFKDLVKRCADETGDPDVKAIDTFLSQHDPAKPLPPEADGMTAADLVTFQVGDRLPTDNPDVQAFWAKSAKPEPEKGANVAECLVTGLVGPVESSLPGLLKRIPGGQSAGIALISANAAAFESHGWDRAQTSPISREAAEQFTKALNRLIEGERTHLTIGGLVYVFWTKKGGDDFFSVALNDPSQVRDMIHGVFQGKQSRLVESDDFYALALSAIGGRAVIRDWLHTTVGNVQRCLDRWYEAQEMVLVDGADGPPLGIKQLARDLYRDPNKEMIPAVPQSLIRIALHGGPLPESLLAKAVMRCRATRRVTRNRAAVIKACLVTAPSEKERPRPMPQLDPTQTDPAYLCGRLLAELDAIQFAALGKLNAPLVDRYFGAASTAPATVFGLLLTSASKAHFPKLRKTKPAVYHALQNRLEEIINLLNAHSVDSSPPKPFPATLTLQEQGLFSVGYYHQRAADHKARLEAAARVAAGKADPLDAELAALPAAADDTDDETDPATAED